jgi:high-affinity iron transporter
VLFYQALAIFAQGLELWVVLGALTAAAALGAAAYAVIGLGKKLPFKQLLVAGASTLLLLSVAFAGNAVRSLQEAGWISVTPIEGDWARLQVFLAELTGIHPTREGIVVQVALLSVYIVGGLYLFGWKRLSRRGMEAARA